MPTTTVPTFTKVMDNAFTTTWYEIQPDAADNIMNATPIWAWLKMKGCLKSQEGGTNVERTVKYALPVTKAVTKGDVLPQGVIENRTSAFWDLQDRNLSISIQRSLWEDRANRGKFRIISYVADRLEDATNGMKQDYESKLFSANVTDESGKEIRSLYDLVPPVATRNTGTWGGINRPTNFTSDVPDTGNIWWSPKYKQLTATPEVNLLSDMKSFYNTVGDQIEYPDAIVTSKNLFELYQEFGLDQTQIVGSQSMLSLGFKTANYNGADLIWSKNQLTDDMRFLNSNWIECVYDPMIYFMMTNWQDIPGQQERIAWIITTMTGTITRQPRRHGLLYT